MAISIPNGAGNSTPVPAGQVSISKPNDWTMTLKDTLRGVQFSHNVGFGTTSGTTPPSTVSDTGTTSSFVTIVSCDSVSYNHDATTWSIRCTGQTLGAGANPGDTVWLMYCAASSVSGSTPVDAAKSIGLAGA